MRTFGEEVSTFSLMRNTGGAVLGRVRVPPGNRVSSKSYNGYEDDKHDSQHPALYARINSSLSKYWAVPSDACQTLVVSHTFAGKATLHVPRGGTPAIDRDHVKDGTSP